MVKIKCLGSLNLQYLGRGSKRLGNPGINQGIHVYTIAESAVSFHILLKMEL